MSGEERQRAWATVVAVALLEGEFGARKGEWKRIAVKAGKVLREAGLVLKDELAKLGGA